MNVIQQRVTELVDPHVEIELLADGFVFTEGRSGASATPT